MEGSRVFANSRVLLGVGYCQGARPSMQDAYSITLNCKGIRDCDFFGVFDGHGKHGEVVSHFVASTVCRRVIESFLRGQSFASAIESSFLDLDDELRGNQMLMAKRGGGSTACAVWIKKELIYCANVGDSRLVVSLNGVALPLSEDHKPNNPKELNRVRKAGGFVAYGRINGSLAVSRAFGDFDYKKRTDLDAQHQMVTAAPEVIVIPRSPDLEFLVMATDGVWDVMSNQQAVDFISERMRKFVPVEEICTMLIEFCRAPAGCLGMASGDNIAVIICFLKKG